MKTHTVTDGDAAALVRGEAPADRPDLAPLADAFAEFRRAAFASPPRPSAALLARLGLAGASEISHAAAAAIGTQDATTPRPRSLGGVRRTLGWFAGLGVVAQVLLGVSVAAATGAVGVGAVAGITRLVEASTSEPTPADPGGSVPVEQEPAGTDPGDEPDVVPTDDGDAGTVDPVPAPTEDAEAPDDAPVSPGEPAPGNPGNGNQGNGNPGNGNGNQGNGNPGNGNGNQGNGNPGNGNQGNGNPGNGNGNPGNGNQGNGSD